jgi:hypothetical protein
MKQDLNKNQHVLHDMWNIMMGSQNNDKQTKILKYWLQKIHVETFQNERMDEILELFVLIYLKCT